MENIQKNELTNDELLEIDDDIIGFVEVVQTLPIPGLSDALGTFLTFVEVFGPDPMDDVLDEINKCNKDIINLPNVFAIVTEENDLTNNLSKAITDARLMEVNLNTELKTAQQKGEKVSIDEVSEKMDQIELYFDQNVSNIEQYMDAYTKQKGGPYPLTDYVNGFNFGYQVITEQYLVLAEAARNALYFYKDNKSMCDQDAWDSYIEYDLNPMLKEVGKEYEDIMSEKIRNKFLPEIIRIIYEGRLFKMKLQSSNSLYFNWGKSKDAISPTEDEDISEYPYKFTFTRTVELGDDVKTPDFYYLVRLNFVSGKWALVSQGVEKARVPNIFFDYKGLKRRYAVSNSTESDPNVSNDEVPWLIETWDVNYNPENNTFQFQWSDDVQSDYDRMTLVEENELITCQENADEYRNSYFIPLSL